jgi:aspartate aminotransferase
MRMGELSVCKRIDKVGVSPTMKVAGEAKAMKARGEDVIDLSVGEPDFPTPQNIKDAAKRAIDEEHTKYTINAGTVELRKAIQQSLKRDYDLNYSLDEIIVSNGAKQSVYNTIMATVHVDDEVIIPAPYWVSYPQPKRPVLS